jgi:hypothetical protein
VVVVVVDDVVVVEVVVVGVWVAALCFFFGFAAFFLTGAVVVVLVEDVVEFTPATGVLLEVFALEPQAASIRASATAATPVPIFTTPEFIRSRGRSASRGRASS